MFYFCNNKSLTFIFYFPFDPKKNRFSFVFLKQKKLLNVLSTMFPYNELLSIIFLTQKRDYFENTFLSGGKLTTRGIISPRWQKGTFLGLNLRRSDLLRAEEPALEDRAETGL